MHSNIQIKIRELRMYEKVIRTNSILTRDKTTIPISISYFLTNSNLFNELGMEEQKRDTANEEYPHEQCRSVRLTYYCSWTASLQFLHFLSR